ncbi:MAG: nuclear transport factor 2 family protein [Chitinophagaceae bacterium]|nr:nuclear transport factor 2 family protein [Chitinophagaceae bacterium]
MILLLISLSFPLFMQAQPAWSKSQQEVQQTVVGFFAAISNRDSVDLKGHCTADIVLFENGSIWNLDTLVNKTIRLNTAADFKRTNAFDFINTTVDRKTAWVTYNLRSEMTRNGKIMSVHWMETVIVVKEKKGWKVSFYIPP